MKARAFLIFLGLLFSSSLPAMAGLTEMADVELAHVSGQAYVIEFGGFEKSVADLTERNLAIGPLNVSENARAFETNRPVVTGLARQTIVNTTNLALVTGKTALIAEVALIPTVGPVVAPVLIFLPTPQIRFE